MAKALKTAALVVAGVALVATGVGALALPGLAGAVSIFGLSTGTLFLASTGLSLAAAALQKKPGVTASQTDRLTANIDPRAFRKTVLGQTAMPVDVRYEEWSGNDQEYCDWIVASASHAIDGFEEIWLNTEMAWSATTGVVGKFASYFSVPNIVLEGTPANAFTFATGKWNAASAHLTGCAYLRLRFKVTGNSKKAESPFSSGIPSRITIIGRGAKLYDPRRDSTIPGGSGPMRWNDQSTWRYTADDGTVIGENLPLQILRVLLGWRIRNPVTGVMKLATGSGVPGKRIAFGSFQIAANLADESVNRAAGGTEPRYHGAAVVSEGDDPKTTQDMLCAACCGRFRDTGGKLSLVIAHNDLAAAATDDGLNDDDVVGGFSWDPDPSLEQTPNVVRGKYVDASSASLYQLIDYPEVRLPSPDGQDRYLPMDLGAVESPSQAQRIVRQVLQRRQYAREFSAPFDIRAWKYGVGDVVPFTFAALGFVRVTFRVKEQELGQNGVCNMTLTYESPVFYQWDANDTLPVLAADPIVYDSRNNPLILAIDDAAGTAVWDGVTGLGRPADNATNSGDPASPFGGSTVGAFKQLVDRTVADVDDLLIIAAPIPDLTGKVDGLLADVPQLSGEIGAIAQTKIPALATDIAGVGTQVSAIENVRLPALNASIANARVETDTAQRRAEAAAADLANTLLRALTEADRTRIVMRDAGIYLDPATGVARLYTTERQAEKISQVEVALNAVTAQVNLRATVNYVNEQIVKAQLTPGQAVDLSAIIARITSAELTIDGLKATLSLTASASTVTALGGTVATLSQQLSALTGTIITKAESAAVDAISTRLSSAEQKIVAYGDVSSYSVDLRQARAVADTNADALLSGLVSADDAARRRVAEQADLQFQLSSTIVAGLSAEAAQRIALAAQMAGNQASVTSSLSALVTTTSAQALQLTGLTASVGGQAAAIQQLSDLQVRADTSSAAVSTTLRQVQGDADAGADATLRALVAGDGTASTNVQAMVQARSEMTTMIVAGQVAQAATNFSLLSRIGTAQAAITSAQTALATLTAATTSRLDAAESAIGAANARITSESMTRTDAIAAEASERSALGAQLNDPTTGLAATRSGFTQQISTLADKQSATSTTVTGLGAAVANNAGAIEDVRKVAVTASEATTSVSTTLRQVTGAGDGSAEAALRAVVAGDSEAQIRVGSIAQVQQDFAITRVADRGQQALTNFSLLARVDSAAAAIVEVRKVVADQNTATTSRLSSAESAIGAANARIDGEQLTRAEADLAETRARETLAAMVNNPSTGLAATRAYALEQVGLLAQADRSAVEQIEAIGAQVNDPTSGLPQTRADLIRQGQALAAVDQANISEINQLQAMLLDPNTGLAAALAQVLSDREASVARDEANASATGVVSASLGKLSGRVERTESVQVGLMGKVAARFQQVAQIADQVAGVRAVAESTDGTISTNLALIAQAVGIWLQSGSQFIRAIGVELVDGVPISKFYGEVQANSITVDKLKVNTAVVPGFASSTAPVVGTGIGADNFVSVLRTNITLAVAGVIDVDGGALQAFANYPSSPTAWQFGLYIDGHLEWAPGGQAPGDAVAIGGQRFCQAGTRTVELVWQGAPTATLRDRYLKIRGFNNTTN